MLSKEKTVEEYIKILEMQFSKNAVTLELDLSAWNSVQMLLIFSGVNVFKVTASVVPKIEISLQSPLKICLTDETLKGTMQMQRQKWSLI